MCTEMGKQLTSDGLHSVWVAVVLAVETKNCVRTLRDVGHTNTTGLEKKTEGWAGLGTWPRMRNVAEGRVEARCYRQMLLWLRWFSRAVFVQAI